jgi:peptidoglycan hydrolase CwlO-like protein
MTKDERIEKLKAKHQELTDKLKSAVEKGVPEAKIKALEERISERSKQLADLLREDTPAA